MKGTHHFEATRAASLGHLLPLALALSACSLVLEWDPEGQKCGPNSECLENYSCLGMYCKADGTIAKGDTCVLDRQCEQNLVCSPSSFTCRAICSTYFVFTSNCAGNEYCRPTVTDTEEATATASVSGACEQSECTEDGECKKAGSACVTIHSGASGCWPACHIDWSTDYDDNCDSSPGAPPRYCQPIGMTGEQRLVCLGTTTSPQQESESCDPANNPCGSGLACIGVPGVCRKYCKPLSMGGTNAQCSGGRACTPLDGVTPAASVCK